MPKIVGGDKVSPSLGEGDLGGVQVPGDKADSCQRQRFRSDRGVRLRLQKLPLQPPPQKAAPQHDCADQGERGRKHERPKRRDGGGDRLQRRSRRSHHNRE